MTQVISMHHHYMSDMARFIQSPHTDCLFTHPRNTQQCMGNMFIVQRIFFYTLIIICFSKKYDHIFHKWTMALVQPIHTMMFLLLSSLQSPHTYFVFTLPRNAQTCMGNMFIVQRIILYKIIIIFCSKKSYHIFHKWTMTLVQPIHHYVSVMAQLLQRPHNGCLFTLKRNDQKCTRIMLILLKSIKL